MKILFIVEKFPPFIVSNNRIYNLSILLGKKHDVTIFTRKNNRWLFPMPTDLTINTNSLKKFYFKVNDSLFLIPIMILFKFKLISNSKFYFNSAKKIILSNPDIFNNFDLVIASGPSWHSFYIAEFLHDNFKIPFILDYRDPWLSKNIFEKKIKKE